VNGACAQASCGDQTYSDTYTPGYSGSYNAAATTAVNNMSAQDRLYQMQGIDWGNATTQNWNDIFRSANTSTVPGWKFRDGPRGVNLDAPVATGSAAGTQQASVGASGGTSTVFPVAMARGASFDLDLEYQIGLAIGDEMVAARQNMMLAPTVNILRHPYWGRAQETYGEDVFSLGRLGSAFTVGVQQYVAACAKHYAANNIENGRESMNVTVDERTLREMFVRHFEMIIKDGGVACIMAAYNQINGTKCTQNAHLLTEILRAPDLDFKGFVLTDWWAMPGGNGARTATTDTLRTRAAEAVTAGLDMEVPWNLYFSQLSAITDATSGAKVTTAQIKTAATRIYEQKLRFNVATSSGTGLKAATTGYSGNNITNNSSHIDLAYKAALEGMVLLKNNNNTLPIPNTVRNVAVVGLNLPCSMTASGSTTSTNCAINFATQNRIGDIGSSRANPTAGASIGPYDGINNAKPSGVTVTSYTSASSVPSTADFVVVMAGLTARDEGEEYTGAGDRSTCDLDGKQNSGQQNALISAVAALNKPMVVVLEGGSVINVEPWLSSVPAVVMAWYPGMVGGKALGELLWGTKNFSGKLPISWPVSCASDEPAFSGSQGYDFGYRYFDRNAKTPRFYFGHGMSYTTFAYSNLRTPCSDVTKNGIIELDVVVTNTGSVAGTETVLAFASYPGNTTRPTKELRGFARVDLTAGQSKQVKILIRASDLKYWNGSAWTVDTGNVTFQVGPSAGSLPLSVTVPVK
jgi:beta-glucosidase